MYQSTSDLFIVNNWDSDCEVRSYQRVVVILNETRLMAGICHVIEACSCWPGLFPPTRMLTLPAHKSTRKSTCM